MERRSLFVGILSTLFILVASSCVPSFNPVGTPDPNLVDIVASGTLTALAPQIALPEDAPAVPTPQGASPSLTCANSDLFSVAYLKAGNVWLWLEGGTKSQLTNSGDVGDVKISDDGCLIAYTRSFSLASQVPENEALVDPSYEELWVVKSDGSGAKQLVGINFLNGLPKAEGSVGVTPYQFDWQPATYNLALNTRQISYGLLQNNDLHMVNAVNGTLSTLLPAGNGGNFTFSPDGKQLAITTPQTISLINADGSNPRLNLLTYKTVITYSEFLYYATPYWKNDSSALMVAIPPEDYLGNVNAGSTGGDTTLWLIPTDGSPAKQIGSIMSVWFVNGEPVFSPDLKYVAYLRPFSDLMGEVRELVVANSDGSNEVTNITDQNMTFGGWSPDSSQFIFWVKWDKVEVKLGSPGLDPVPLPDLTGGSAVNASLAWTNNKLYILGLEYGPGVELDWINVDGIGIVLDTYPQSIAVYDFAN